VYIDNIGVDIP